MEAQEAVVAEVVGPIAAVVAAVGERPIAAAGLGSAAVGIGRRYTAPRLAALVVVAEDTVHQSTAPDLPVDIAGAGTAHQNIVLDLGVGSLVVAAAGLGSPARDSLAAGAVAVAADATRQAGW